jgi:SOS-response transcriptional repressor LexA
MKQEKNKKNFREQAKGRVRVKKPELAAALAARLGEAISRSGMTLEQLGKSLGGYTPTALSNLTNNKASGIPLDLLVCMAAWAVDNGISLRWLLAGLGGPDQREAVTLGEIELAGMMNNAIAYSMLLALAARLGADIRPLAEKWHLEVPVGGGTAMVPLGGMCEEADRALAGVRPPARRGYTTVESHDVPSGSEWWRRFVPVIGRVAAGVGTDTIEAGEYPPAWAGEFLAYEGAPPTAIAVRVAGDSMLPRYAPGDMLVVDTARRADPGQIACVLTEADGVREARVKKVLYSGPAAILLSENPAWPPERMPLRSIVAVYQIIKHLPQFLL